MRIGLSDMEPGSAEALTLGLSGALRQPAATEASKRLRTLVFTRVSLPGARWKLFAPVAAAFVCAMAFPFVQDASPIVMLSALAGSFGFQAIR